MMENNQTVFDYVTYKFYDDKDRRLSIFGKYDEENKTMGIHVITCSKKDSFNKEFAREQYKLMTSDILSNFICKPEIYNIPVTNGKPKATFLDFCKSKYHRKRERQLRLDITGIEVEDMELVKAKANTWLILKERY